MHEGNFWKNYFCCYSMVERLGLERLNRTQGAEMRFMRAVKRCIRRDLIRNEHIRIEVVIAESLNVIFSVQN